MNKYDYGFEIHPDTTTEWAYHMVHAGAEVLEIGCSNGNLTMHLQKKGCAVDIVELDEAAGTEAQQFARSAMLGEQNGDVEKDNWFSKLQNNRYDYIVVLDVLEHLRNPEKVLIRLKKLLAENGSVIISVPNMGHNSVMIDMLQNKLQYNELGILDNTHLRFFTKDTLERMISACGLVPVKKHAIQIPVGSNEIKNSYKDLDSNWEILLKNRPYAEVFQFVYQLKCDGKEDSLDLEPLDTTKLQVKVYYKELLTDFYDENNILFQYIKASDQKVLFTLPSKKVAEIRINLLYMPCILDNLQITLISEGSSFEITKYRSNGEKIKNGCFCFSVPCPELIVKMPENVNGQKLQISFHAIALGSGDLEMIHGYVKEWKSYLQYLEELTNLAQKERLQTEELCRQQVAQYQSEAEAQLHRSEQLKTELALQKDKGNQLLEEIEQRQSTIEDQMQRIGILEKEMADIYHSKAWKFITFLRKIKKTFLG